MINKSSLVKKLASYSAVVAAVLAVDRSADAQVIYTPVSPGFVGHDTSYNLDLNNDGIVDFEITEVSKTYFGSCSNSTVICGFDTNRIAAQGLNSNLIQYKPLSFGSPVNSYINPYTSNGWVTCNNLIIEKGRWNDGSSWLSTTGAWARTDSAEQYLPLELKASGNTYYGWVRLLINGAYGSLAFEITGYAYNATPGATIYAGQECDLQLPDPVIQQKEDTLITNATTKIQWYYNGNPIIDDTSQSIVASSYGLYSVTTGDTSLCHGTSLPFNYINCSTLPKPVITSSANIFCDDNIILKANSAILPEYYTIGWLQNDTALTNLNSLFDIDIFSGGNFSAVFFEPGGCADTSNLLKITADKLPPPYLAIHQSNDTLFSNYNNNITWSNSDTGSFIIPKNDSTYGFSYTDSLGCKYEANEFTYLICNQYHPVLISTISSICYYDIANLLVDTLYLGYTTTWYLNDSLFPGPIHSTLVTTKEGTYYAIVQEVGGCIDTTNSLELYCQRVWPGDANEDLVVNNYDLIPIGLYYGDTGPARDTITNTWVPHAAPDWDSTQTNGMNRKFVDCNGDGTINSDDTLAVSLNYGLSHPYDSPGQIFNNATSGVPLYFISDSTNYQPGGTVHTEVWVGNVTNPVKAIYGLAYDIGINTNVIQPGTLSFSYDSSFIGVKNENVLALTHLGNDVETVVTGIDHINKTGYGKIGDLYFTLAYDDTTSNLVLSFTSYEAVDAEGNIDTLSLGTDTLSITNTATGVKNIINSSEVISIFPDPAKNQLTITSSQLPILQIEIENVLGQTMMAETFDNNLQKQVLDVSTLPAGMYFYRVTTINSQIISGKFIKD